MSFHVLLGHAFHSRAPALIKAMLPLGFALLFTAGLSAAFRCIVYLFGPTYLNERAGDYAGTHHADLPEDVAVKGPITD